MMKYVWYLVFLGALWACKQPEDPGTVPNTSAVDSVRFIFTKEPDQNQVEVEAINLKSLFFHVDSNKSWVRSKLFNVDVDSSDEKYLKDSIMFYAKPVKIGCKKGFEVDIGIPVLNHPEYNFRHVRYRNTELENGELISSPHEFVEHFHWPADTNRYHKVFDTYSWYDE